MEELLQKLTDLLHQHFPGSDLELESEAGDRVGGFVTWEGFAGLEQIERQRAIWNVLKKELSTIEQRRIAALLTLTPEEMASARAD